MDTNFKPLHSKIYQPEDKRIMEFFLSVIGMVMIVEGLPYFAFPDRMKFLLQRMKEVPDSTLRKFGFVLMLMGLSLVYIGRG